MPSITIPAVIGGVATLGSAAIGASAAGDAANAQTQAAQTAANTQLSMYNQTKQSLSPFSSLGSNAFSQLASIFGFGGSGNGTPNMAALTSQLQQTPGYQFALGQGTQALDRSAASRGLDLSGGQLKDLTGYGQGLALSNTYQPYISALSSAAGLGENAAAMTGNAATAAGQGIASSQLAAGQAQASGIVSQANNLGSGLNQFANAFNNPALGSSYGAQALAASGGGAYNAGVGGADYVTPLGSASFN